MRKKSPIFVFPVFLCCCLLLLSSFFMFNISVKKDTDVLSVFSSDNTASAIFIPEIKDASTLAPIENAKIVVLGENKVYTTDKNGHTQPITVFINNKSGDTDMISHMQGDAAFFVYADGYAPFGYFNLHLEKGKNKKGPTVFLQKNSMGSPTLYSECPDSKWAKTIIENSKP